MEDGAMRIKVAYLFAVAMSLGVPQVASAADLPVKAPSMLAPAPIYNWTGFYVGGNIGYGWGNGDTSFTPLPSAAAFINLTPMTLSPNPKGVLGGLQLGYNWQAGTWLLGAEADIQASGVKGDAMVAPIPNFAPAGSTFAGSAATASENIKWFGTLRARAGILVNPMLLAYATGGLAYGNVAYAANTNYISGLCPGCVQYPTSFSKTKAGWTVGAGLEWAFMPNWTAKIEYLYIDLGSESATVNPVPANPPFQVAYNWKTTENIVRVGLNWKFP
jgi:outer membrane immunogenic protein